MPPRTEPRARHALAALLFAVAAAQAQVSDEVVRDIDAKRAAGTQVLSTFPIFHQLLVISYPAGFKPAYEVTRGGSYLQESVPVGETVEQWTQMLTVTGIEGAAADERVTPERVAGFYVDRYRRACPETLSIAHLPPGDLARHAAIVTLVACGTVRGAGAEHSEAMLLVTLKGERDYYSVQWAEQGAARATPQPFDEAAWRARLERLLPIRLCAREPGLAPASPACLGAAP